MKKTEIAMTLLIASVAMVGAFFLTNSLFGSEIEREANVEVAKPISKGNDDISISLRIFHESALNPTVEVYADGDIEPDDPVDVEDTEPSAIDANEDNN